MPGSNQFSKATLARLQSELFAFLEERGPATKIQITNGLRWHKRHINRILASQPEWLVAVGRTRAESKFGRLVLYHCRGEHVLRVCQCGRKNFHPSLVDKSLCQQCLLKMQVKGQPNPEPRIVPGVDASQPTTAMPSSEEKIRILEARLDLGLPLWVEGDERHITNDDFKYFQPDEEWDDEID